MSQRGKFIEKESRFVVARGWESDEHRISLLSNETIPKLNGDGCTALGNKPRVTEFYYKSRYQKRAKDDTGASVESTYHL